MAASEKDGERVGGDGREGETGAWTEPEGQGPPAEPELQDLRERASQADEMKDRWMRAVAELQNTQKRLKTDRAQERRLTIRDVVRGLLPSFDNLGRALQAAGGADSQGVVAGVRMVNDEIHRILADFGVTPILPERERFDPNFHEAVSKRVAPGVEPNTVLEVHEKGYRLGDLVIRPARVVVSAPAPEQAN